MAQDDLFGADGETSTTAKAPATRGAPRIRPVRREQLGLEVVDLDSLLPDEHPARTLWAAVEQLDLRQFYDAVDAREGRAGRRATDPKMLVALWLYATADGVGSARQLDELCKRHAAYKWICGGVSVNYHLLAEFRVGHEKALDKLLSDILGKLMAAGLVTLKRVAHDGMRVRASAGAASFRRKPRLVDFVTAARKRVDELKAEARDPNNRDRREAANLRGAEDRLRRVEAALAKMPEVEAIKQRQNDAKDRKKEPRVSTTDPQARVMKMGDGGFRPAYNLQLSTDVDSRFIVGVGVSTAGSDAQLLGPALDDIERRLGRLPNAALVDGGFAALAAIDAAAQRGVTVFAPVPKPRNEAIDPHARKREDTDATAEWRTRMATDEAKVTYRLRASTAETTNADLRCRHGIDRFLVRGTDKVTSVLLWGALAYNLLRTPLEALLA
jgi:transposase